MDRRDVRFPIMLTEAEDREIQEFRFAHQIGTKAEAARSLIKKGLEAAQTKTATSEPASSN
ncbi:hypothetical protein EN866_33450 [Mesorhizobium sp. M2D.F.Ca.ET.223.01.1.1]|uniref:hypothetical protein n=1 Tax=Mesorhizobium sp. M2D.F.Ca.ET.223.01.1.1 TaxID=2563940 RepID=UPI0010921927|nr:hypothetical protein [Mesorhizobium sp. M2D.F.Ca.ET.223.01.1.1]TGR84252.1 hypothetical protein EN866_33450 [Mesorhizobium sp. M2D.F.Ca.ET.223.01.1.1]TGT75198.1 hypothetical protein EN802_09345 [bacterium M00.F.Ca.ET.159.01.1.1]TGT88065.1 hypothetical protein EN800_06235 [bacterium M00.F.Ca.ET.157.01.1.1]